MNSDQKLFSEFPPVSQEAWDELIKKDLRGGDYKNRLKWHTGEGIDALPFYRKDDLPTNASSRTVDTSDWEIRQTISETDVNKAHEIARHALQNGVDALNFRMKIHEAENQPGRKLNGLHIQNQDTFKTLVDGIDLSQTPLYFEAGQASPLMLAMLHNEVERQNLDHTKVKGSVLYDPYAFMLTEGRLPSDDQQFVNETKQLVSFCDERLPAFKCLGVDARIYHHAGGTLAQELGYALAAGSEYLATLSEVGLETKSIASALHFNFSIGSLYFPEIAKYRAARKLWRIILDQYDVEKNQAVYLHGTSSAWNKTQYEPYVNMLRSTTEGMSAAISGCDAITLTSFDTTFRQPDDFSRRIARNTQIILKEEAYFNKVADPAAGSYYLETLTHKIAEAAWHCFQEIEQQGGLFKAVKNGYVQSAIKESRNKKDDATANRGRIFVGINAYPNTNDTATDHSQFKEKTVSLTQTNREVDIQPGQLMSSLKQAFKNGASLGDLISVLFATEPETIQPLPFYRGPQAFETLRQATEDHETTPQVLTLPLGNKKMRKARSAFAVNFLGCAGYDITDPIGFDSVDEAITEIKEQQPDIIVLCSSDEAYEELVPKLCDRLNQLDQKSITVVAGYPEEKIDQYKNAGIDIFIHSQSNVLETLMEFQQRLGIIS